MIKKDRNDFLMAIIDDFDGSDAAGCDDVRDGTDGVSTWGVDGDGAIPSSASVESDSQDGPGKVAGKDQGQLSRAGRYAAGTG